MRQLTMNPSLPLLSLALLLGGGSLFAQEDAADYFPLQEGRSWTYTLTLNANGKQKKIEYTTKIERSEELSGKQCVVLVSRSAERLIKQEWYSASGTKVLSAQQQGGARQPQVFQNRVLFERKALKAFKGSEEKKPSSSWTCSDGSTGTVTLDRRERVFVPKVGDFRSCVVIVDRGVYHTGKGDKKKIARTTDHTMWLAPDLGLVKETVVVKKPDGAVTFSTEAVLTKFQTP